MTTTLRVGIIGTDDALQSIFGHDINDGWIVDESNINEYLGYRLYISFVRIGEDVYIPKDMDLLVLCDNVSLILI